MNLPARFPYTPSLGQLGMPVLMPLMPALLVRGSASVKATLLVDSGSMINVLPFSIGKKLGVPWNALAIPISLGGISKAPAKAMLVDLVIGPFIAVQMAFGWAKTDDVPLLLGQVNFFEQFDVCFHRSQLYFEVQPKP